MSLLAGKSGRRRQKLCGAIGRGFQGKLQFIHFNPLILRGASRDRQGQLRALFPPNLLARKRASATVQGDTYKSRINYDISLRIVDFMWFR